MLVVCTTHSSVHPPKPIPSEPTRAGDRAAGSRRFAEQVHQRRLGNQFVDRRHSPQARICEVGCKFAGSDGCEIGWEAGTRTPIARSRVWSPTIGRPPSKRNLNLRGRARVVNQHENPFSLSGRRRLRTGQEGSNAPALPPAKPTMFTSSVGPRCAPLRQHACRV